ncbi:Hypothetical_protein [Hexamita inflata]|uniref:Hypothetical_protein n=1 Tax=Hexamita inflata TaxID=28002 RepID=A0AA86UEK7_9EUKA|nr:Hypothetical protein HINF_LOCUS40273 [Hexamita inflata]CAI9952629.1 Hypothetical protein HINF_LOCUS40274 [Hexamita inflata]
MKSVFNRALEHGDNNSLYKPTRGVEICNSVCLLQCDSNNASAINPNERTNITAALIATALCSQLRQRTQFVHISFSHQRQGKVMTLSRKYIQMFKMLHILLIFRNCSVLFGRNIWYQNQIEHIQIRLAST